MVDVDVGQEDTGTIRHIQLIAAVDCSVSPISLQEFFKHFSNSISRQTSDTALIIPDAPMYRQLLPFFLHHIF